MKFLNRIDQHYLQQVLAIQSYSGDENDTAMHSFILDELKKLNVKIQVDKYGNIYVTKGNSTSYPCIAAHIDTVHPLLKEITIYRNGDTLFAFDPVKKQQTGIGGDDKVGVYVLLQALKDVNTLKAVFFRDEEISTKGSEYSIKHHKKWYNDCNYIIQVDRKYTTDFITTMNGAEVCSTDFYNDCNKYISKYEYKKARGITTDVSTLAKEGIGISVANISCGYYAPHTSYEIVSISGVNKAYNLLYDIVTKIKNKKYSHEYKFTYKNFSHYSDTKTRKVYGAPLNRTYGYQKELFNLAKTKEITPLDISNYATKVEFKDFVFEQKVTSGAKVYRYIGIDELPLIHAPKCSVCGKKDCLTFLPYEGKIYCTEHNNYIATEEVQPLLRYLETDDDKVTFVYSVYLNGWLLKYNSVWHTTLESWVPNNLPF